MSANTQVEATGFDTVKLLLALAIVVGAILGFYYLDAYSQLLRVIGLLVLMGLAAFIVYQTALGRTV